MNKITVLDKVFSEYIRRRDADEYGRVKCCTCPAVAHWAEMDCGHFVSRGNMSTRYDEMNCHAQCKTCNQVNGGEWGTHMKYIADRYDYGVPGDLIRQGHQVKHWTRSELHEMIKLYRQKSSGNTLLYF